MSQLVSLRFITSPGGHQIGETALAKAWSCDLRLKPAVEPLAGTDAEPYFSAHSGQGVFDIKLKALSLFSAGVVQVS